MISENLQTLLRAVRQNRTLAIVLAIVLLTLVLAGLVNSALSVPVYRWGDGSTYYMQVLSIAYDHDIQYTQTDLQRIIANPLDDVPSGMYLIKNAAGQYFYGKDYSYSLFAAPFFLLEGNNGILLFNALLLFCMILMGYLFLRKKNGLLAPVFAVIFFVLSTTFVYMYWMNPDLYDAFLIMLGLFIWLKYMETSEVKYLAIASMALGLAAVAKAPDAVVFIPVVLYEIYKGRFKNLMIAVAGFLLVAIIFIGYFYLQSGTLSFYGGDRLYYLYNYPFMNGYNSTNEAGSPAPSISTGSGIASLLNLDDLKILPYNLFYYFFGRFTGMMWYYTLAIFALVSFLFECRHLRYVKEHPEKVCIFTAIVLFILAYTFFLGNNYFGGGWAVGNRYMYIYPAFIFLLDKIDLKKLAVFLIIALITVLPIVSDPLGVSNDPTMLPAQAPFTYFPLELSQLGALPLYGQNFTDNYGNSFNVYNDYPAQYHGSMEIAEPSDLLLLSSSPIERLDITLYSPIDQNGTIITNGFSEEVPMKNTDLKTVTITGMKPIYSDSSHYVYDINVPAT
jgi:hypothetical protein